MASSEKTESRPHGRHASAAPSISLPKGGGAIRGIGEKFAANPVTGTGSMSVPIAVSPGRSGFGPKLSLSYDSSAGNGPFGLGWNLSLPSITRKTDKGLPRYFDAVDSDVFILSSAEDLVPEFERDAAGSWVIMEGKHVIHDKPRSVDGKTYNIRRFRPRIEGLFARIERWTNRDDPADSFWRSISKDNITTWYGRLEKSRILDPEESSLIYSWLISESHDDKGNVIVYEYKEENSVKVNVAQAHERNRRADIRKNNRYIKSIRYGNHHPYFPEIKNDQPLPLPPNDIIDGSKNWNFEVIFDYGEHDPSAPKPDEGGEWSCRNDPFSSYRAGFEVRTYRLCQRVLMFHHFPNENKVGPNCLVRSTNFEYSYERNPGNAKSPIYSRIVAVSQSGYKRNNGSYDKRNLPPLEFEYTQAIINDTIQVVDAESLENLPQGLDGAHYQWVDLDGEGISGILTEQAGTWFYKQNVSALPVEEDDGSFSMKARFEPLIQSATIPSLTASGGKHRFLDLAGDGRLDVVTMEKPVPGFYERTQDDDWEPFRPFRRLPNIPWDDPNLRLVDLNGDGHADVLITEGEVFTWYPSLGEKGFDAAKKMYQPADEEQGPRLVFTDGTDSIYLADLSGDGLSDLARIRNDEVCYWPNLGYGRFGPKVTMDKVSCFDHPDQFDQKRIRLADIDGSGTTDIIYLHGEGVRLYFNQSGNSWSDPQLLDLFPKVDNFTAVMALDLLGNGTACLVWSSPLPRDSTRPMRYVDLMGGQKPHLLVRSKNNLGVETVLRYAPSTKFYLQDKRDGKPWITKIPFPVHVVERVETYDHISNNRFVTRYAYHHGYFDGEGREFRGFGMVEQWDTEKFAVLTKDGKLTPASNIDIASHIPPVYTKTWFHTGIYLGRNRVSNHFSGLMDSNDRGEYYREPAWRDDDDEAQKYLLEDTPIPDGLTLEEERQACRALKGSMLRQEVYARDDGDKEGHPYMVTEQNFTVQRLQSQGSNKYGVFFTHPREALSYHYERNADDPRLSHAMTLEVDGFGNVLKSLAVGYGRRAGQSSLQGADKDKQEQTLVTYTENEVTNAIDDSIKNPGGSIKYLDDYRTPLPAEIRTYEVTGYDHAAGGARFSFDKFTENNYRALTDDLAEIGYEKPTDYTKKQRRLIEHLRTIYRPNNLGASQVDPLALLALREIESKALPGESYKLAFTPALAKQIYVDSGKLTQAELGDVLQNEGMYVHLNGDANWWIPSRRIFYSPGSNDTPAAELAEAEAHFYLPRRYRDPFHKSGGTWDTETFIDYDGYALLVQETCDSLGNRVTAGIRKKADNTLENSGIDYRVLQPYLMMDPNRNRTEVAFDLLGLVVGTAVMGKPEDNPGNGDLIDAAFNVDLSDGQINAFFDAADPHGPASNLLAKATTRIIYDLDRFYLAQQNHPGNPEKWEPPFAATLARETHHHPETQVVPKIQISFSYSDGFGREIQKKIQAEPGPVPQRDANGKIIVGADGQPVVTPNDVSPRWIISGWTIFNNKGKPVRQYEPFFDDAHHIEFDVEIGISPVLFYDPLERVVATLHPNHTWEKVVFTPWEQKTWDVNDTVLFNPATDPDVSNFFQRLPNADYLPMWHALRTDPAHGAALAARYPDSKDRTYEASAAKKAAAHADTPTVAHLDTLGRTFLTVAHNKVVCPGHERDGEEENLHTRVELDIEGNQRTVRDAVKKAFDAQGNEVEDPLGRIVMSYDYDIAGPEENEDTPTPIHQAGMEAGERWTLFDMVGKPIRAWDSRGFARRMTYDELRRSTGLYVTENGAERLTEKIVYGENQGDAANHRGQVYQQFDQACVVTSDQYDFKGNLLKGSRQLQPQYKQAIDWKTTQPSGEIFKDSAIFDALNRPIQLIAPHSDQPSAKVNVIQPGFNDANLLERVDVWLNQNAEPAGLLDPATASLHAVTDIDYDAKGQRMQVDYGTSDGKVIKTHYTYDHETFRLTHLYTRRGADPATGQGISFTDDCENLQPPPPTIASPDKAPQGKSCGLQNFYYTYDPTGNITHIRDEAQQTIYFKNKRVKPSADYTYDSVYRLIQASGREHLGQHKPIPHSHDDSLRINRPHPGDSQAMGTYIERYVYDEVGNFLKMQHRGSDILNSGWTRTYAYEENSLLEDGTGGSLRKQSNRLSRTTVGNGNPIIEPYNHDAHGNMTSMPHLVQMDWDFEDQLQQVDLGGGGTAYYVYDTGGERIRKVIERQNGTLKEERIYLGGFEIYRKYHANGSIVTLERETLHVMDDQQRIALVETRTQGNDGSPPQLIRYQFGNHLGSAGVELNEKAQVISYEEYSPYGTTVYQAVDKKMKTAAKRYRYTGKEWDEESGLNYHWARYYAAWLGRWMSCDPIGLEDGICVYRYSDSNPINFKDPNGRQITLPNNPRVLSNVPPMSIISAGTVIPGRHGAYHWSDPRIAWEHNLELHEKLLDAERRYKRHQDTTIINSSGRVGRRGRLEAQAEADSFLSNLQTLGGLALPAVAFGATYEFQTFRGASHEQASRLGSLAAASANLMPLMLPPELPSVEPPPPRGSVNGKPTNTVSGWFIRKEAEPAKRMERETGPKVVVGRVIKEAIEYRGRWIIVSEGKAYYRSSEGTSGKKKGGWYRFYGIDTINKMGQGAGWVGKQLLNDPDIIYLNPALQGTELLGPIQRLTGPQTNQWLKSKGVKIYYR